MLERLVEMGNRVGCFLIATADNEGTPHIASARRAELLAGDRFAVTEWFCPGTIANLQTNPRLSVVAWDSTTDIGYQVIGESAEIKDVAMLDGFEADRDEPAPVPQVERRLLVSAEAVLEFKQRPHSDRPV